jgi:hypothetical protein
MAELPYKPLHQQVWRWMQRNEDTAFAVIIGGITVLFIIGIVTAFNFAASDVADRLPQNAPAATERAPAETTGAGGTAPSRAPPHDPREDEQMERP